MTTFAERLAAFALGLRFEDLPAATVAQTRRLVTDTLGCALGALGCEPARLVERRIPPPVAGDRATVFGSGAASTAAGAALVNGTLTRYLDFMDVYWSLDVCHPSENIPAALAIAESAGASGRELVEAIVAGYELQLRLCDALSLRGLGLHHVSAAGFVVPLMAARLWRLGPEQAAHAMVLGGVRHLTSQALSRGRLSMAKAIGYPLASMECLLTTRLAADGMTGPLEALDWLFRRMPGWSAPDVEPDLRYADWRLDRVSLKRYPVQFELQGPVDIAARLHRALRGRIDTVERIVVEVLPASLERTSDPAKFRPANRETADHSLPCCVAMALLDGDLTHHQFEAGRWSAPDVAAVMAKIEVVPSGDFEQRIADGRPAAMTLHRGSEAPLREVMEVPPGDAARPMDDAAIEAKFRSLAEPALGADGAGRVLELTADLELLADLRELTSALVANR